MKGTIKSGYGAAEVRNNDGTLCGMLRNGVEVEILEATGKPRFHIGEWFKIQSAKLEGWVRKNEVQVQEEE